MAEGTGLTFTLRVLVMLWLCTAWSGDFAAGQSLNLDVTPQLPNARPSIDLLRKQLAVELTELGTPRADDTPETRAVLSARRTLRRFIIELADRGRNADAVSLASALAAHRLADARTGFDRYVRCLEVGNAFTGSPPRLLTDAMRAEATAKLDRFARSALEALRRSRSRNLVELDAMFATTLKPVIEVIAIIEHRTPLDRWPTGEEVLQGFRQPSLVLSTLEGDSDIAKADQRLESAREFPDLAAEAESLRIVYRKALQSPDRITAAGFSEDDARDVQRAIEQSAALLMRSETWPEANIRLERAEAAATAAEAIARLQVASSRTRFNPEMLRDAWADARNVQPPRDAIILLRRIHELADLLVFGRDGDVNRELQPALRSVAKRRQRLERQLADRFPEIVGRADALRDPAVSSLLLALESTRMDEERIFAAEDQVQTLTAIRPSASREFVRRIRTLCGMLARDNQREQGAHDLDQLNLDFQRFVPMPFEQELRSADESVQAITGGTARELIRRIELLRSGWADEIAAGELNGPRRLAMEQLARIGSLLENLQVVADSRSQVREAIDVTNRWGAWYVPAGAIEWTAHSITPGLKMVITAALKGEEQRLERDLERLEAQAPPTQLLAWLSTRLSAPLAGTLGDPAGAVVAIGLPPTSDMWLRPHRGTLAAISIGLIERKAARDAGDPTTAEALTDFVVRTSRELFDTISTP